MRQKQLRIRIACLTLLASLSYSAVTLTQGRVAVAPDQKAQSFPAILNFAATAVTSRHVTDVGAPGWPHSIDLYTCGQVTREILPDGDPYFDVTDLAIWISQFTAHFKQEGTYEMAAPYLKWLTEYGEAETQRVDAQVKSRKPSSKGGDPDWNLGTWQEANEARLERLAKALNSAVHRREYVVDGGCGAGEILVSVKIPAGSAALLINTFHFTLCQARGTDPWNAQGCYGWKTVGKIPMMLSGAYRYVLTSADGQKKIGDVLINTDNGVLNLK
jgi:hypothetical protein